MRGARCRARGSRGTTRLARRPTLLDGKWSEITGVALDRDALLGDLGRRFELDAVSFKPVCAAKQTIAAIHAFRD